MSNTPKTIQSLIAPDSRPEPDQTEGDAIDTVVDKTDQHPDLLDQIRHFFSESEFDPYEKHILRSGSYRVAGDPCHGGYADDLVKSDGLQEEASDKVIDSRNRS